MTRNGGADLVITGLEKSFGPHPVLRGIDLTVPAGSFTAVLGPSGSGKTTLLRILAGFERPDAGTVAVGGTVLDTDGSAGTTAAHGPAVHVPPERRRIGYVPQEGSLFPHLTAEANVAFGLARRERKGKRPKELLEAVGLGGFGRRFPHQLSGGQQQRVALARALAVDPSIVLLDEPFTALDETLRASLRSDVHQLLREAGATAVLVTHDQDEALSMSDYVAVIREGRIAQVAPPYELYARPVDAELARFVGEANVVEGVMVAGGSAVKTVFGEVAVKPGNGGAGTLPAGTPVHVLVRPEQVEVSMAADGAGVPGRVVSSGFHGHDSIVRVAPVPDSPLAVPVTARVLGEHVLHEGTLVRVSVRGPVGTFAATEESPESASRVRPDFRHLGDPHAMADKGE